MPTTARRAAWAFLLLCLLTQWNLVGVRRATAGPATATQKSASQASASQPSDANTSAASTPATVPAAPSPPPSVAGKWRQKIAAASDRPVLQVALIVAGTLISEDAICVLVGLMIRQGTLSIATGGIGCFVGIYIGDLLFFFIGRAAGLGILKYRFFARRMTAGRLQAFGAWFDRRPWAAIATCRVMPGLRVPLYLAVGALTRRTAAFFAWTAFFAFVWTPLLIGLVVLLGETISKPLEALFGGSWKALLAAAVVIFLILKLGTKLFGRITRPDIPSDDAPLGRSPTDRPSDGQTAPGAALPSEGAGS